MIDFGIAKAIGQWLTENDWKVSLVSGTIQIRPPFSKGTWRSHGQVCSRSRAAEKLNGSAEQMEICDEQCRIIGYFLPVEIYTKLAYAAAEAACPLGGMDCIARTDTYTRRVVAFGIWIALHTWKHTRSRFSAASCWAQAGNFYQAIAWCDELLGHAGLPDAFRRRIESYAQQIRTRRARWYAELATTGMGGEE